MYKLLIISVFHLLLASVVKAQIFVNDLVAIANASSKNVDDYLSKRGFVSGQNSGFANQPSSLFIKKVVDSVSYYQSVEMFEKNGSLFYALHTTSKSDVAKGFSWLRTNQFSGPDSATIRKGIPVFFQKKEMVIRIDSSAGEEGLIYTFTLEKIKTPPAASVRYAEDLLQFSSHQVLVSYFGEKNVRIDSYLGDDEVKPCSVVFPNTNKQALFVWNDATSMSDLSYVLISGVLPTDEGLKYHTKIPENQWELKSGVYSNMSLRELIKLNGEDFNFFGTQSEFAFSVEPKVTGDVDFKKVGVVLGCLNCISDTFMKKEKVSAAEAVDRGLSLYVFYIMLNP